MDNTTSPSNTQTLSSSSSSAAAAAAFCRRTRRKPHTNKISGEEDGEKAEVEEKIAALQKIVPGGDRLPVEELFEETAEYIFNLECQIKALRFLAAFVQSSENQKRKLGG